VSSAPYFLRYLELGTDADETAIRRAYARKLKKIDQEADAAGFQALREAYEAALSWSRRGALAPAFDEEDEVAPAETAEAAPSPAPAPDPDPAPAAPAEREDAPQALARAVFAELAAAAAAHPGNYQAVKKTFELALEDPRLIRVDAKDIFEWLVAEHLLQGWRPGNEALIDIAARGFDWDNDRGRLKRFGWSGAALDQAVAELNLFTQNHDRSEREGYLQLIRRLRTGERPGDGVLANGLPVLERLAARYPALFPLITSSANLERWRAWAGELPGWRRKLGAWRYGPKEPKASKADSAPRSPFGWTSIVVAFIVLSALSRLVTTSSTPTSTSSGRDIEAMRLEGQKVMAEVKKASALLAALPTQQNCGEVARYEHERTSKASAFPRQPNVGPILDRRILDCASAGLWPHPTESDPAVQGAIKRQALRHKPPPPAEK
jgi:periplasmic protein TonB